MQYIEPRQATIRINDVTMDGMLSGSHVFVKFESQAPAFLMHFPEGKFDSMHLAEKDCTRAQWDIIETAQELVRLALKN